MGRQLSCRQKCWVDEVLEVVRRDPKHPWRAGKYFAQPSQKIQGMFERIWCGSVTRRTEDKSIAGYIKLSLSILMSTVLSMLMPIPHAIAHPGNRAREHRRFDHLGWGGFGLVEQATADVEGDRGFRMTRPPANPNYMATIGEQKCMCGTTGVETYRRQLETGAGILAVAGQMVGWCRRPVGLLDNIVPPSGLPIPRAILISSSVRRYSQKYSYFVAQFLRLKARRSPKTA